MKINPAVKFLHVHRLAQPKTYQRWLEIFARATQFAGSLPMANAKSRLAVVRVRQLQLVETQLKAYHDEIERLFLLHPDAKLFDSLPGAGKKSHRASCLKLAMTALCFPTRRHCNVWPAPRQSVFNPARYLVSICAASATSRCVTQCIFGPT
jgi:hypothetical protein